MNLAGSQFVDPSERSSSPIRVRKAPPIIEIGGAFYLHLW